MYRERHFDLRCGRCSEEATHRANCCGEPLCDAHRLVGDACFGCGQALLAFDEQRGLVRGMGIWAAVLIVVVTSAFVLVPSGLSAVYVSAPLAAAGALIADRMVLGSARKRLIERRARVHGWERPKQLALPEPNYVHKRPDA